MVDRFADADPSNNQAVDRETHRVGMGVTSPGSPRTSIICRAGVTDIWLTPIFSSRSKKFDGHGAFHGYWTYDLDQVDARFGGLDVQALRRHTGSWHPPAPGLRDQSRGLGLALACSEPQLVPSQPSINNPEDSPSASRVGSMGSPPREENPAVTDYLIGRALHWVQALQPDGFRLDALTHVPVDFVRTLGQTLGDKVELFGEFYDGRAHVLAERWRATGIQSAFDFPSHFALINTICGDQPMHALASVLALDRLYQRPSRPCRPRPRPRPSAVKTSVALALAVLARYPSPGGPSRVSQAKASREPDMVFDPH